MDTPVKPFEVGSAFQPYGMDSVGRITFSKDKAIRWSYDHAPEVEYSGSRSDVTKIGRFI